MNKNPHREQYFTLAKNQLSRLFSRMDREKISKTFGSFDRTFWSWKFTDFSGSRFQESLYVASWFYNFKKTKNEYYKSKTLLNWIEGGLNFWVSLQHKDGSFDEAYPYERSLAATAFTSFYIGEAYLLLKDELNLEIKNIVLNSLLRSGDWLCHNSEKHGILTNHIAAAAASLIILWKISNKSKYLERANFFLNIIYSHQNSEGWYEEYGGADIGYQSHGCFYLARIWTITKDKKLLASLRSSIKFFKYFVHPNGTIGGEYGSRNTTFYFPAAFEILASVSNEARSIAKFMRASIFSDNSVGLNTVDAYNFSPMINNYIFAYEYSKNLNTNFELPFQKNGIFKFRNAGIFIISKPRYYAIFSSSKGGVLKVFSKVNRSKTFSNCGYWGALNKNEIITSQSFSLNHKFFINKNIFKVRVPFVKINQKTMNPWLFICFRIFSLTVGRNKFISQKLKNLLVKVLINNNKNIDIIFDREVEFKSSEIIIKDFINGKINTKDLYNEDKFSSIHMGSSKYFHIEDLNYLSTSSDYSKKLILRI